MAIINGTNLNDNGTDAPILLGTAGGDSLNANWSSGSDFMFGLAGNDTYRINSGDSGDYIAEQANQGIDTVITRLANTTLKVNFENLTLDNTAIGGIVSSINGTGNSAGNSINGNSKSNKLNGLGGNDTINGGAGEDTITGGTGKDDLTGGTGKDVFNYDNVNESPKGAANYDVIRSFVHATDKIDLFTIDADLGSDGNQKFAFVGNAGFSGGAEVRWFITDDDIMVQAELDDDGDFNPDIEILLIGAADGGLSAIDFTL